MFEWLLIIHVFTTLLVIPAVSYKRFEKLSSRYSQAYGVEVKNEIAAYVAGTAKPFFSLVFVVFAIGLGVSLEAVISGNELFHWDHQAGLIVLFLIAFLPVIVLSLQQKQMLNTLKRFQGGIRHASLTPQTWSNVMPKPIVLGLIGLQFVFFGTVVYFINHPFEGFAGFINLLGLMALNLVFGVTTWMIYHSKKFNGVQIPQQRHAIKARAIQINSLIWILAILQITVSMWIAGLGLDGLKLITQSLYLQVILLLTAFTLSLPVPDQENTALEQTNVSAN